jgi:hypothetical protein
VAELKSALVSECGRYRYNLERCWCKEPGADDWSTVNLIMLNPSTADGRSDDPTIRKCIRFAKRWGYTDLVVTNLFAWRATEPEDLALAEDAIGPENDAHIASGIRGSDLVVCAWGAYLGHRWARMNSRYADRAEAMLDMVRQCRRVPHALALTRLGKQPGHPLFLRGDLEPRPIEELKAS